MLTIKQCGHLELGASGCTLTSALSLCTTWAVPRKVSKQSNKETTRGQSVTSQPSASLSFPWLSSGINTTTAKISYISGMQASYPEAPQGIFSSLELIRMGKPAHSHIITSNSRQWSCEHWNSWFLDCLKSRRSCDYSVSIHNLNTQLSTQAKKLFSSVACECAVKLKDGIP